MHRNRRDRRCAAQAKSLTLATVHVFEGEVKTTTSGLMRLSGYHLQDVSLGHTHGPDQVQPRFKEIFGAEWTGYGCTNPKYSTFFPKTWSRERTELAIRAAAAKAIVDGTLNGPNSQGRFTFTEKADGIFIFGVLSPSRQHVVTAYPEEP